MNDPLIQRIPVEFCNRVIRDGVEIEKFHDDTVRFWR